MSQHFFQFKQFTVWHERCAMKVSTDACLFGAWVAEQVLALQLDCGHILDIGTGTGLLPLMLAQKLESRIDAVEIDEAAYGQATDNVAASAWGERIWVMHADIKGFQPGKKYDLILSNPPFYENSLLSPLQLNNQAKHHATLTLQQLLQAVNEHLGREGCFAVLLPHHRMDYFIELAFADNYHLLSQLLVSHSAWHPFSRSCLLFGRKDGSGGPMYEEMQIKQDDHYTVRFSQLLKDYYLYL